MLPFQRQPIVAALTLMLLSGAIPAVAEEDAVSRGEYLVRAGGCSRAIPLPAERSWGWRPGARHPVWHLLQSEHHTRPLVAHYGRLKTGSRQVPGRVTVNRLAKGCSLPDPRGTENAVGRINVGTMSQSEEVAPRAQKSDLSGRARRPGFSAGWGQI